MKITHPSLHGKLSLVLAAVAAIFLLVHELDIHLPGLEAWIASLGAFAPLAFITLFVAATPLFLSVDTLCFAAGLLFGLLAAEIYMMVATYLAAAVIFYLGRHWFKDKVVAMLAKHRQIESIDEAINREPLKLMFLLRLTPLPFAMLSYAFAVTDVRLRDYLLATSGILVYNGALVYLGYTTKHLAGLMSDAAPSAGLSTSLLVLGLLAFVGVLYYVAKKAGEAVRQITPRQDGI